MYLQTKKTVITALIVLAICQYFEVSSLDVLHAQKHSQNVSTTTNDSDLRNILDNVDKYPAYNRPKKIQRRVATVSGGRFAVNGQFPWMANVRHIYGRGRQGVCGGTIISSRWILTAAHCVNKYPRMYMIILGEVSAAGIYDTSYIGNGYSMMTSDVVVHENYHTEFDLHDIALIRAPGIIPFNDWIRPIQMAGPTEERHNFVGETGMIFGWGRQLPLWSNSLSTTLKYTSVPIISNDECSRLIQFVYPSHVCTSTEYGSGVCSGDSGGPLVVRVNGEYVQLGITSGTGMPCASGEPAIFVRVASFRKWIDNVIRARR